jgi:hypothetical protein
MNKEYQIYNRPGLEVVFSNGSEFLSLYYITYEWPAAEKFYGLIKKSISNNASFISDTSFNVTTDDEANLIDRINNLIQAINLKYDFRISSFNKNSDLNFLHRDAVPVTCELWRGINDAIHAYEQYKVQINDEPRINAYFKYMVDDVISLEPEDFLFFKTDRLFGDLCLNYTYKGKHWLEIQSDNDFESINDGQLQPETRIAPDAYLIFRPPSPSPFYRLNKFVRWFKASVPNKAITSDMALGYLLVGKLVMPAGWESFYVEERSSWTRMLSKYKTIVDVKLIDITEDMVPNLLSNSKMINNV